MKRPTMLVKAVLRQAALDLDLSVELDVRTLERRCKHEGFSFLTITLPGLSDALEFGIETGLFSCPSSFARHGRLPTFLKGFFNRVFTFDGRLRDDACPEAVGFIRQICRFFKKVKKECSTRVNRAAIQHFVDVEGELRQMTPQVERKDVILDKIAGIIWSQVFPEIDYVGLVCHHGPGNTADKLSTNGRRRIRKWNQRSEYRFPSDLHCYPNYGYAGYFSGIGESDPSDVGIDYLDLKDELPVRVVFVPKTQKAPRVIAMEPSHMQFMQQSVKDLMYAAIESHALTRRSIRFTRQEPNQLLAYKGSIDKRTSTLDLKDASDRVHLHLVQRVFKNSGLLEYLEDARSLHAILPDGRNIVLTKYASQGSALCFPVEASVFYTLIQSAMHQLDGRRPSSRSIAEYSKKIAVYGDDIVVPTEYTDVVVRYLESYALKVNVNKSFSEGNFRESCGADFFKGISVSPVYARQIPHDNSQDWGPKVVMAWVATANSFYERGQWVVADAVRTMVQHVLRRPIPLAREAGEGVFFLSFLRTTDLRWNAKFCGWKQKRIVYQPTKKKDDIHGDDLACLNHWAFESYSENPLDATGIYSYQHLDGLWGSHSSWPSIGRRDEGVPQGSDDRPIGQATKGIRYATDLESLPGKMSVHGRESLEQDSIPGGDPVLHVSGVSSLPEWRKDYCPASTLDSDPTAYLCKDAVGLDFASSTKRGVFKSKHRWISLAS